MKVYEIYEHPERGRKAVKVGVSWTGFFFHFYWAVIKRLWLPAGVYFLFILFFLITRKSHVVPSILPLPMGTVFMPLLLKACFAVHGNQWISQYLINHGYQLVSKLNAKSGSDALWRFENSTDIAAPIFSPVRKYGSYVSLGVVICFWLILKISFPAFYMAGPSMLNTLKINDRVITNHFAYAFSEPKIGDLVVFRVPETISNYDPKKPIWIKRIVGLAGDRVTIEDRHLRVNGQTVTDPPFLAQNIYEANLRNGKNFEGITVGEGEALVFGDDSENSYDGRYWGTIPAKNIIGKVVYRFWPLNRMGSIADVCVKPFEE